MANEYIWKDLQWNSAYNEYWRYPGHDNDLKKCFKEVFNLDFVLITTGTKTEVKIENDVPLLILHGGAVVSIGSLPANTTVCMKKHGSDSDGEQEMTSNSDGKIVLNGSGNGVRFYFGEVSISVMKIMQTYLFNGQQLDALNSQTPYLKDTIQAVRGAVASSNSTESIAVYSEVDKDYESSVNNNTINKELLNQIGVNKISIPRYKILEGDNECHFEGLSFPINRKNKETDPLWKNSGQFCHDNKMLLAIGFSKDSPYWSTTPHVYPEIVFNNTTSMDANFIDVNGTIKKYTSMKKHTMELSNNLLTIDSNKFPIAANDSVVVYIREEGAYKSNYQLNWPTIDNPNASLGINFDNDDGVDYRWLGTNITTSTLTFSKMQSRVMRPCTLEFVCNEKDSFDSFQLVSTEVSSSIYRGIINDVEEFKFSMPRIKGSAHSVPINSNTGNLVSDLNIACSVGEFEIGRSGWDHTITTMTLKKEAQLANTCTVSNMPYIGSNYNTTLYDTNGCSTIIDAEAPNKISGVHVELDILTAYVNTPWMPGTMPSDTGYFGDYEYVDQPSNPLFAPNVFRVQNSKYLWDFPGNREVQATIGYLSAYDAPSEEKNFAVAIVIWRNGKLIEDNS